MTRKWSVPERDPRALRDKLTLDGFPAGRARITILRKREAFRTGVAGVDPDQVARFDARDIDRLLGDAGVVRHRAKIEATIGNARACPAMRAADDDCADLAWALVDDGTEMLTRSAGSDALSSAALESRGFKLVRPVIICAWMQTCRPVGDHEAKCFRRCSA